MNKKEQNIIDKWSIWNKINVATLTSTYKSTRIITESDFGRRGSLLW